MWERVLRKARRNRAEDNRLPKKQMGVSLLLGVIRPSVFCPARRRLFLSGAGDQRPANDPVPPASRRPLRGRPRRPENRFVRLAGGNDL
ncbi:MAG: hypothetical protein KH615_06160 [Clostridiales bacterium]|nr:hypothetical protein [Clostridiales bacterium]